jgi:hypothetical protein
MTLDGKGYVMISNQYLYMEKPMERVIKSPIISILDGKYEITSDKYQWILKSYYMGVDKDKNPKLQYKETYWAHLAHIMRHILDTEAKELEDLNQVIDFFKTASETITYKLAEDLTPHGYRII